MIDEIRRPGARQAALACAIGTIFGGASLFMGSFPLFLEPVSREFGWGRGVLSTAFGVSGIAGSLTAPLVGRLVDRFGARRILSIGITLFGLGFVILGFQRGSALLIGFNYAFIVVTSMGGAIPFFKILIGRFRRHRGLMMGIIIGGGNGVGVAITAIAARYLIATFGWREAYVLIGAAIIFISLPAVTFLLRENQKPVEAGVPDVPVNPEGLSTSAVLRTSEFWVIIAAIFLSTFATGAFSAHAFVFLTDQKISGALATSAISITALASILGQIGSGWILDNTRTARGALPFFVSALMGLVLIDVFSTIPAMLLIGAALLGLGSNAVFTVAPYFISRFFGLRSFSELQGLTMATATLAMASGPAVLGIGFDLVGNYGPMIIGLLIALAMSTALILVLPGYGFASQRHISVAS